MRLWIAGLLIALGIPFCIVGSTSISPDKSPGQIPFNEQASISVARQGGQVMISFQGNLQSAGSATGPWADMTNSVSPMHLVPDGPQRFYRARQAGGESIFASRSVAALTLTGPFQAHFDLAFAGTPDGIFPPKREKPYFDGRLQMGGLELPISLRVRGNSSLQECPFPKLKFKISKERRPGTPFFDAREIKIGTHCAEGGRGTIGRLRDQTATFREAMAYEMMELMGFIAPRARRARIQYRDTTISTNENATVGWIISREALIHDDIEVVAERLGGRALDDEEVAALTNASFDEQLVTDLLLFHALLGNWDYQLSANGQGLWNTDVIALSDGKLVPVAGDFDLASWVTGMVRLSAPRDYHPELGEVERQARYDVEQVLKRVGWTRFFEGRNRFLSQRVVVESLIAGSLLDEDGRANMLRHIAAFFDALEAVR